MRAFCSIARNLACLLVLVQQIRLYYLPESLGLRNFIMLPVDAIEVGHKAPFIFEELASEECGYIYALIDVPLQVLSWCHRHGHTENVIDN